MQKIRSLFRFITIVCALVMSAVMPLPLYAQAFVDEVQPLMVIRFNQPRVYYDQQLYSAVSQAVAVKSDVMFDVVSNAPLTGNPQMDAQWVNTASRNTQAVIATLKSIGVPMERMHITGKAEAGLRFDETRIYVR
jgi:hypothetical protein